MMKKKDKKEKKMRFLNVSYVFFIKLLDQNHVHVQNIKFGWFYYHFGSDEDAQQ